MTAAMRSAVAPSPATKPDASRRCGERRASHMSVPAATGRMKRPIENPVTRLKLIRNPARLQARNHRHPRPPGPPCRLHARAAAMNTRSGHARIISTRQFYARESRGRLAAERRAKCRFLSKLRPIYDRAGVGRLGVTRGLRLKLVACLLIGRYSDRAAPDRQGERVTADYAIESPVLNEGNIGRILSEDPCAQTRILQPAVPVHI